MLEPACKTLLMIVKTGKGITVTDEFGTGEATPTGTTQPAVITAGTTAGPVPGHPPGLSPKSWGTSFDAQPITICMKRGCSAWT